MDTATTDIDLRSPPRRAESALKAALTLLDGGAVAFATLRDPGRDGAGVLEADVLIDRRDQRRAERLLVEAGFRRRPSWGRHPHRFFLRPVASSSADGADGGLDWVKLDLVTDLSFGPWHQWTTGMASACLAARSPGPGARLAPADELLAHLLHAVLDRGVLRPRDIEALSRLAPRASTPGVLGHTMLTDASCDRSWARLVARIDDGDWRGLLADALRLRALVRDQRPVGGAARHVRNRTLRRGGRLLDGLAARGALVALVGPDGTGKTTLATSLVATAGVPARGLYGGTYRSGTPRSRLPGLATGRVLTRLLGTRARVTWHRRRGRLVVLDRHPTQARPGAGDHLSRRARLRRRCLASTLPRPDLLVVLDAPPEVLHERRPEHSVAHLEDDRRRHLALRVPTITRVLDASAPPDAVRADTVRLVWEHAIPTRVRTETRGARSR